MAKKTKKTGSKQAKPESASKPSSKSSTGAAAEKQPEKSPSPPSPPPPPPPAPSRQTGSGGLPGILWTALTLIVVLGGGFATKALWLPLVVDYLPRSEGAGEDKEQADRIAGLERELKSLRKSGAVIDDLEKQRVRLNKSLTELMARLSDVEGKLDEVGKMTEATAPSSDPAGTAESLRRLSERVAGLAKSGESLDTVLQRLTKLEQALGDQEKPGAADVAATKQATAKQAASQALVLAIGNLRESLKSGQPFARALAAVGRLGGDEPDVGRAVAALKPHAADGIPTLETLRLDYAGVASAIAKATPVAGDGLVEKTMNRIKSLVTVRRLDDDGASATDGGPAPVRRSLEQGKLDKAIETLGALEGPALAAAEPWLKKARARLDADAMMASLNRLAISLLVPAGE